MINNLAINNYEKCQYRMFLLSTTNNTNVTELNRTILSAYANN